MGNDDRTSNSWLKYFLLDNGNLHCYLGLEDSIWLEACLYGPDMTWCDPPTVHPNTKKHVRDILSDFRVSSQYFLVL